ncbi:unhealthy ribosome biogenesis protein 2 homolog [Carcharodon carcharias]|uniref:unhealthy ribosome biogenesis protein 2 homolog n=1 Tax=Carcharodon carcharias TaxID=13397 RepID=UPI001B7F0A59|nr:unhealthy ribosome biogenesis protein 2 homolog [Carcharodon carcharias]XP_041038668.1 unhealthy ribosome biogenesis protein 2 homolog [Carcharodon carcharias]
MAAIYSGIHQKIKSAKTPWGDKLKLARFAWISHQCFLPNKEQVLVDWVSHALTGYYSKKLLLEDEIVEGLWIYLDDILHSVKLQKLLEKGKIITIRATIAQIINDRIWEHSGKVPLNDCTVSVTTVLSCCQGILTSPALSIIYTSKWELLVDLLCKLSILLCSRLKSQEALSTTQLFDVLLLTFEQYLVIQRQQHNQSRVFLQVCGPLLQPFLLLRHLLSSRCWMSEDEATVRQHLSKEICNQIQAALHSGLFHADFLNYYREELLQSDGLQQQKMGFSKALAAPVEMVLLRLADADFFGPDLHPAIVAGSVPLLFRLCLESYCRDENHLLGFHIFTRFFDSLGFQKLKGDEAGESADWNPGLLALDQLLNSILSRNIYNIAVDKIRCGGVQFTFYSRVAEMLLTYPLPATPTWFRCLKTLILLNHLIVEPNLDDLVSLAWIDADVNDSRVKRAQEALLSTLLEIYTKLRQLPRLFKEVLAVVSRPAADELRQPILSFGLTKQLCECLLEVPASQVLDIWDLILKSQECLMPELAGNSDMALKVLSMSTLLNSVLFNMKSLDSKTPAPIVLRTQLLMDKMARVVVMPLFRTARSPDCHDSSLWAERAMSSGLILSYTWVEVDHMLKLNCGKYISPGGEAGKIDGEEWNLHCPLPQVGWGDRRLMVEASGQSSHFLQLLAVQEMKKIMLQPGVRTEMEEALLRSAALFIVQSGKTAVKNAAEAQGWDGEAGTINDETYAVAHWHLVTSNLVLLVPYLPKEELTYVADVVMRNLLLRETREAGRDPGNSLSIPTMCESLLNSTLLPEMQPLHRAILLVLMERVRGQVSVPELSVPTHILEQLGDRDDASQGSGNQQSSTSESLVSHPVLPQGSSLLVAHNALSVNRPAFLALSEQQLDRLLRSLDILSALRLDSLSCTDHLHCFLFLVSLVSTLKPGSEKTNASKCLQALSKCYFLLTILQTGTKANVVFKLAHAGDILVTVTAPLFPVSSELSSCVGCPAWPEFLGSVQRFLTNFIQTIVERKQSMRLNLEQFVVFLSNAWLSSKVKGKWKPVAEQLLIVTLSTLSRVIVNTLQRYEKARHTSSTLHSLLAQLTGLLAPVLHSHFDRGGRLDRTLTVPCVAALLEAEQCLRGKEDDVVSEGGSQDVQGLQHSDLYQRTCFQVLHQLTSPTDDLELLRIQLEFLQAFCSASELCSDCDTKTGIISILSAVKALLAAPWMTAQFIQLLDVQLTGLLQCLAEGSTNQQFYLILKSFTQGLEVSNLWKGQHQDVVSSLILTTLLLKCPLSGDVEKAVWFTAPQIIMALLVLCKEAALDHPWGCKITLLSLETLAVLIQQGEGMLSNPHHVTLAFDALLCVSLDHLKLDEYGAIFRAIQAVLFSILQSHPKVLHNAAPSFLKCFNRLVLSIMHKGRQKCVGEKATTTVSEVVLECAHLVERTYTHIASKAEEFAIFSAFTVALYVNELQKVTLNADVKRHLTGGMYHLLDLVTERDLRFLNASLQTGVREVFKELYNDYTHYHKSKRQGEEKYTA